MPRFGLRFGAIGLAVVLVGILVWTLLAPSRRLIVQPMSRQPNIVLILSDDEDRRLHAFMPKTRALLARRGTTFDNYFVTSPLCAPSRASILRGQYAHNHRIEGNRPPSGGFERFRALGREDSTAATWLRAGGYHTALLGKYLNGYRPAADGVPPGWDEWYVGGNAYRGYGYTLNENGRPVAYGHRPRDYLTDVLARKAAAIIRRVAPIGQPLFLYVAPFVPHIPATPAPRHGGLFADAPLPRPPSFNEADVGDKPAFIRGLPRLKGGRIGLLKARHRDRLRSMQAVDDMVGRIVHALREVGQLDNTYIIYTSDNGYHMGQHRLLVGKNTAYEEDVRVPLVVRGPGVPIGGRLAPIVLNVDLAATFAGIAGIEPPGFVDGRSFLPLLADPNRPWRESFVIERRDAGTHGVPSFNAIRTAGWTYVEHDGGERELYDHGRDPHQLENLAPEADPAFVAALSSRLAELVGCAAARCRELENLPLGE